VSSILLPSIGVPACVSMGFSRDMAMGRISNSAPKVCSIVLLSLWFTFTLCRVLVALYQLKVIGMVLFAAIREPAGAFLGLSGTLAVLSVCDGTPQVTCSIVLEAMRLYLGFLLANPFKVLRVVLLSSVGVPACVNFCLSRDSAMRSVGYSAPKVS
jgi:hypothetical protein